MNASTAVHITLNNTTVDGFQPAMTVAQVLDHLKTQLPKGEVVMEIFVDDQQRAMDDDDLQEISALEIRNLGNLAIHSQPVATIADEAMENLQPIAHLCESQLEASAKAFRLGQITQAFAAFADAADLLQDLIKFLNVFSRYKGLGAEHQGQIDYEACETKLTTALSEFEQAQNASDWNLVADLIQYEIGPLCGVFIQVGTTMAQDV